MNNQIEIYIEEFKKHYRYSPTQLGKIERIENYIVKLQKYYNDNVNKYEELLVKYFNLQEENNVLKEQIIAMTQPNYKLSIICNSNKLGGDE